MDLEALEARIDGLQVELRAANKTIAELVESNNKIVEALHGICEFIQAQAKVNINVYESFRYLNEDLDLDLPGLPELKFPEFIQRYVDEVKEDLLEGEPDGT